MKKATAIFVVLIVICGVSLFIIANHYIRNQQQAHAVSVMRIVFESFIDEQLAEKSDGYNYSTEGLANMLLLTTQQQAALKSFEALGENGQIRDPWGGFIYVTKYGTGIRIHSNGPDLVRHTPDDLEFR